MIERLTNLDVTNSVDRSIPATALRTLITSFPRPVSGVPLAKSTQDAYNSISKVLIPRLVGYVVIPHGLKNAPLPPPGMLESDSDKGVDSDAVDVLVEVIRCFGPMLQDPERQTLQKSITKILDNDRTGSVVKKKAIVAMSLLAVYLSDAQLNNFVSSIAESFRNSKLTLPRRRLFISMIGSLVIAIPHRLGSYLKTLAPFVINALSEKELEQSRKAWEEDGSIDPEVEEVREAALVTLEGFLSSCSNEMRIYTEEAVDAALRFITYDTNFTMDEDDEEMGGTQDDEENDEASTNGIDEEEDFEEEEALSDDDDSSWKVRRCAAKVLYTIISTRSSGDLLESGLLYRRIAPVLIERFKEREENVRLEVLSTLASLIRKTGETSASPNTDEDVSVSGSQVQHSRKRRRGYSDASPIKESTMDINSPAVSPPPTSGPKADLARLSASIINGVAKLLKQKSIPTKQAAIILTRDLVLVQHGILSEHIGKVIDPLAEAINAQGHSMSSIAGGSASASGSNLRTEALQLISAICDTHSSKIMAPYVGKLVPGIITAAQDKYYKISSEAIAVIESVIKVITPLQSSGSYSHNQLYINQFYDVLLDRAVATDADLEVRQRAIRALGVLLARSSASVNSKLLSGDMKTKALDILYDRLRNETTRLPAVRAIDTIFASNVDKDALKPTWVRTVSIELGAQLRKADRNLRSASVAALRSLISNPVMLPYLDDRTSRDLVGMLLPLLSGNDLNFLGIALIILTKLVERSPKQVMDQDLTAALCSVVLAPLGGPVLEALLNLFQTIGIHGVGQSLMQDLLKTVGVTGDPAIVGKAIGALLVSGGSTVGVRLDDFVKELHGAPDDLRKCLALSILGESGQRLGSASPLHPDLFMEHFKSTSEQVPRAAAIALGRAGAGNIDHFLPVILSTANTSGDSELLLLHSMKEILQYVGRSGADISQYTKSIWEKLLLASQAEDNRVVGAECIGRLTLIDPKAYLPSLQVNTTSTRNMRSADNSQNYLQDPKPTVRGMVIQAVRFTFADSDESFDEVLKPMLIKMLTTMLNDSNLENRRLAVTALNSATRNKPEMILPDLAKLLPLVMKEAKIKPELVREVQMGPFKHKVDDGLEVRKVRLYSIVERFGRLIANVERLRDVVLPHGNCHHTHQPW